MESHRAEWAGDQRSGDPFGMATRSRFRRCVRMHLMSSLLTAGDGLVESSERMSGREGEHADAVAVGVNRVIVIRI